MASIDLSQRKTYSASTDHEYSYIHIPPTASDKATLLFLHGFPSHIPDWLYQIQYFSSRGYGILIPDLLGYGQSSKPTSINAYGLKAMSAEIIELLDHLHLPQVVGIGHDWGATFLSRLATWYPTRFQALVFLAVGPTRPGTRFDVDLINEMSRKMTGFEALGYIPWIAADGTGAQEMLERNAESAMSLMFCADPGDWDRWFRPLGKMQEFVTQDRRLEIGSWYTSELRRAHLEAFGRKDGYLGATRWYRMWMQELFLEDEKGYEDFEIGQRALFVLPREPTGSAAQQEGFLKEWVRSLRTVKVDSGHWVHLEKAEKTNLAIQEFLDEL